MQKIRVATINIRNRQDRWFRRRHLLVGQLIDAAPDLISLQEIDISIGQGRWLRGQINARLGRENKRPYTLVQKRKRHLIEGYRQGVGVLTRLPIVYHDVLNLGYGGRPALRVNVRLDNNRTLDFVATHLHSGFNNHQARQEQAMLLTGWLKNQKWVPNQIIAGDFNALPGTLAIQYIKQQFLSAYEQVHQYEPLATFPTALVDPKPPYDGMLSLGWAGCLDYIFVSTDIKKVATANIFLDIPSDEDAHLYPSDHVGLIADVVVE
ncbi:MAG: endonuclease/exonuclease/phosphatase family protein [Chloroflexota bacterium]